MGKRDEFVESLKRNLDELNHEIDDIEAKAKSAGESVKAKYNEQLAEAKTARSDMETQIEKLREASEDTWEDLKADADKTWKALRNSVNYFKSHFK